MQKISKAPILFVISSLAVLLDQLTKLIFVEKLPSLVLCNAGVGFGLSPGRFDSILLSSSVLFLVFGALLYFWKQNKKQGPILPLALVMGAALSNLLDRVFRGCVIDYIDLKVWPSFNLADVLITFGLVWTVYALFSRTDS
ncbi:MAG: signal peptidase II [Candidatus Berkelbacteria bacterium]|nr:signal peptidase II [Candidatus Berkelbacteria bacterium]